MLYLAAMGAQLHAGMPPMAAHTPGPVPASPPLVRRGREQAGVRDALAWALAGRGSLVLIGGAAGIGKTALARDLAREARARGASVLVGRAYDLSEAPPFGVWLDLLGPAGTGEAADPLDTPR